MRGVLEKKIATLEAALERAERDAQRWERCAVAAERAANVSAAHRRTAEIEAELARSRARSAGRELIEGLDDLAARIADLVGVPLPQRGCPEDDD